MSYSSLWFINKEFKGEKGVKFGNSWLFTPIADDVLFNKYLPEKVMTPYGKASFLSATMFDNTIVRNLNNKINNCGVQEDRIVWEITNQQIFSSKDKNFIADSIIKFINTNKRYMNDYESHILDRFKEISEEIRNINEDEKPYFVFKNSSCDDNIEFWFERYNEEEDEYEESSLLELERDVTELVIIEDDRVTGFIINTKLKDYIGNAR